MVTTHLFISCQETCIKPERCAFQVEFQEFCSALGVYISVASECEASNLEKTSRFIEPTTAASGRPTEDSKSSKPSSAQKDGSSTVRLPTTPKEIKTERITTPTVPATTVKPDLCSKSEDYRNVATDYCFSLIFGPLSDPKCNKVNKLLFFIRFNFRFAAFYISIF